MKQCKRCCQLLTSNNFSKRKDSKDGLDPYCKQCKTKYLKEWQIKHPEKYKTCKQKSDKQWYTANKTLKKATNNKWISDNKEYVREWYRNYKQKREQKDPCFKIANKLRTRMWYALKNNKKCKFSDLIGCTISELKTYLESKFQPGMSWDNYGEWHIDHIKPLSRFDLTKKEEQIKACHYTNLQPLWAEDNLSKGDK